VRGKPVDMIEFDFLSIGIASLLYVVIHFTWYSNWLFGDGQKSLKGNLGNLFLGVIIAYFLSFFEGSLQVTTVSDGMFVAFCVWLGFVFTTEFSSVLWMKKPIHLFIIDTGANCLSFVVMGGIIGA